MKKTKSIKLENDAFGQMLWAHQKGNAVTEIWERDDGYIWASSNSINKYFLEYDNWAEHEKIAMEFVKGTVLDIGCGAGRHALYLQKRGFDVIGIDNSPLAIKVSKLRGLKKAEVMSMEYMNFKTNSFGTIIMMGNNFSLFENYKKARRMLKRLHNITCKNACLIAETCDPYKINNPSYLEYYESNKKRGRMSGQFKGRERFEKYISPWFDWLMASKEEMEGILNGLIGKLKNTSNQKMHNT